MPSLRWAVGYLCRLPFADAAGILPLAEDPRPSLREMAIRGLPWLDAFQACPMLIEALGDDRAGWAIYALRKAFAELPRPRVLAALQAAPLAKVTVHKEVLRLLGELGGKDAYEELLRHDRPELHRDVRIALLRALWDHLGDERTWAIFERAGVDPDWMLAAKLADIPVGRVSDATGPRVMALLARILARPSPRRGATCFSGPPASLRVADRERLLFRQLLAQTAAELARGGDPGAVGRAGENEDGGSRGGSREAARLLPRRQHLAALLPSLLVRAAP